MKPFFKIIKYQLQDLIRGKWILLYALLFFVLTDGLFRFGDDGSKVVLSLMNITLFIIPLVSIVFGSMFFYSSREFIELLLAQPIGRGSLYRGMYVGLATPLSLAFVIGVGIPFTYNTSRTGSFGSIFTILLISGIALTFVFTALAYFIAVKNEERVKGVGLTILVWLFFAVIYDGIVLAMIFMFSEYPLDKASIAVTLLNPIDLARIMMLLTVDISALLGYTGAVFKQFFGSPLGLVVAISALIVWMIMPVWLGLRSFAKKDL